LFFYRDAEPADDPSHFFRLFQNLLKYALIHVSDIKSHVKL